MFDDSNKLQQRKQQLEELIPKLQAENKHWEANYLILEYKELLKQRSKNETQ